MIEKEKSALEKMEELLKAYWRKNGKAQVIAAKHSEFIVEPKVFIGNQVNPEILELLVVNYLANTSKQDSGTGRVETTPDRLVIKSLKGKPLVMVRDRNIIQQYLSQQV